MRTNFDKLSPVLQLACYQRVLHHTQSLNR